ncbi:calpain-like cysteine peptidase [Novymonas esmeraldas]|uniref:Calpain-like cysteine peptidase n=1 Tax=Novymonas esmeraldas TaxID=1808958 RepID=A0AAW0ELT6_9TRYP
MSSSTPKFVLDAEAVASLRAALAGHPAKLQRLEERLVRDAERAAQCSALQKRIAQLRTRNTALREAALPAPSSPSAATVSPHSRLQSTVSSSATSVGGRASRHSSSSTTADGATPKGSPLVAASGAVDEFEETTIQPDSPAVPTTWWRRTSLFRYGGPAVQGSVTSVIDDGVLYRLLLDGGGWAFYNDTRHYTVQVRYRIAAGSTVTPGPSATAVPRGSEQEVSMVLGPEETAVLLTGRVVDFENLCQTSLLPKRAATAEEEAVLCAEPLQHWAALAASYPGAAIAPERRDVPPTHLVAHCVAKRRRFVDPHFFPSHASLYRPARDTFYVPPLHWRLPRTYLPKQDSVRREVRVFRGAALQPDGLCTGRLFPNNMFLAVAVGLACRWPQALRRLFLHPQGAREAARARAVGAYHVGLCAGGWWRPWIVDEFVPAAACCPEFTHSTEDLRVLWVPLLEKACAKSLGSYAAMLDAPLEHYITALTGGPCTMLREVWPTREDLRDTTAKATRFFTLMTRLLRKPGTAAMPSVVCWLRPYSLSTARSQEKRDRVDALYSDVGLDPSVATVVLGLETLGDGACIARLRQTAAVRRSTEEWLGVWRRSGKSWVDEVGDLVFAMGEAAVQNTVWMALEDVPQYFQGGCVAPLTEDWAVVKVQGKFTQRQPSVLLHVTVTAPTRLLVSVTQRNSDEVGPASAAQKKGAPALGGGRTIAGISCLLFSKGGSDGMHFVGANGDGADAFDLSPEPRYLYERDVSAGLVLDPREGPYHVAPCLHSTSSDVAYTLTAQLVAAESGSAASALAEAGCEKVKVKFMTAKSGAVLFQNLAQPILRHSTMEACTAPVNYQSRPPTQPRLHFGAETAVTLRFVRDDVQKQQ